MAWMSRVGIVAAGLGLACQFGSTGATGSSGTPGDGGDDGAVLTEGTDDGNPGDGAPTSGADDGAVDTGDDAIADTGDDTAGSTGEPPTEPAPWWNDAWSHRAELVITETADGPLPSGYSVVLEKLDAQALFDAGQLLEGDDDLRVVRWDGASSTELDRRLQRVAGDTGLRRVWWKTAAEVENGTKNEYWLYWGNPEADPAPSRWVDSMDGTSKVYLAADDFEGHDVGSCPDGWGPCAPEWSIQPVGNGLVMRGISPQNARVLGDFVPTTDVIVHARVRNIDTGGCPGLVTGSNGDTWLWAGYGCEPGGVAAPAITLQLVQDGNFTTLMSADAITATQWRSVVVAWIGNEVTLAQDGVVVGTSDAMGATPGGIGFSVENNLPGDFDDIFVRRLVLPEPTTELGPEELAP